MVVDIAIIKKIIMIRSEKIWKRNVKDDIYIQSIIIEEVEKNVFKRFTYTLQNL
jgi:hypothetical protein